MKKTIIFIISVLLASCGDMDKTLKNDEFLLKGPFISEKEVFFFNPAINSIIKINAENGGVSKFKIKGKIYTILDQLLPSIYIIIENENTRQKSLVEYDSEGKEKNSINLGSPFTLFEVSQDKEYLIMRHSLLNGEADNKKSAIFFKNEIGILELKSKTLKKMTLNFSMIEKKLIFSDPLTHLVAILCHEGVVILDYKNPERVKYVYLDINKKSPEIESAYFSKTGRYLFLKAKGKDDIYALFIDNEGEDLLIKVNVPSSPFKGLVFLKPITINDSDDTFIAQYLYPLPKLTIMSAESNNIFQNQIALDSNCYILDAFNIENILYVIIVNYWLKYIKITSLYPIAENIKEDIRIFADDFLILGYSSTRDIVVLQFENKGLSVRHIRPSISSKSIKIRNKEFSFSPYQKLYNYSDKFNLFFFVSDLRINTDDGKNYYQFNYINFNNDSNDQIEIDFLPSGLFNINELSFILTHNSSNDILTLINFQNKNKVITYIGLKYNELSEF
ncbi:MAG: hypothetical protein N2746_02855 [Deltaproteobacteria bacterium]|nr:hypothetical protein [Deltaproteobacteria bacterium]